MRILHFSDVHVTVPVLRLPKLEMLNKRMIGAGNLVLRRGPKFRDAPRKLQALAEFMNQHAVDLVINTGDYTALGTLPELALARDAIEPFTRAPKGFITVPGNHDIYLNDAVRDDRFARYFGDLLTTDAPELATDGPWPLVRFLDPVVVVCVNSARPNPEPWLSSGRIPDVQLRGLEAVLADRRVREQFVVVATHYAPRLANGRPDSPRHGLDNADEFLDVCRRIDRGLILCGHVHRRYRVQIPGLTAAICCAGSATHAGHEGFWLYDVDDQTSSAVAGVWNGSAYQLG